MNKCLWLPLIVSLAGCQALHQGTAPRAALARSTTVDAGALFAGRFDNHEQVWTAREAAADVVAAAHVIVTLSPAKDAAWSIWRIHLDASTPMDALWAMQRVPAADGAVSLLPYRALVADPGLGAVFDAKQWTPLDACALHGDIDAEHARVAAEAGACTALAPGIGPRAALLPLAIEREGEWLHVRLFLDQARGADARVDARKVETYIGWAAVNGSGPQGNGEGNDWHMDRTLRLGSEGGRAPLTWRDGKPSGYSLGLERLTYREGNIAVLKLSVIEDASGRTLAYAWANPQATRIGLSLGWVQVGLQRADAKAVAP